MEIGTSALVIRDALGVSTSGSRSLAAIVPKRLDGTIRDLSGAEYWKVYWETFLCEFAFSHHISTHYLYFLISAHYELWMLHHRNISDVNFMYRKDKNTGEVFGVLLLFFPHPSKQRHLETLNKPALYCSWPLTCY